MALRLADSSPQTIEQWYTEFAPQLRRYVARRVRDRDLREDIVQDVFLTAHRARGQFDGSRPAWPWLATIAANRCRDAGRRAARSREDCSADAGVIHAARDGDPHAELIGARRRRAIAATLEGLAPRQRRLLLLREVDGCHYDEMAASEGLSEDAVKSLLKRARTSFRQRYAQLAEQQGLLGALPVVAGLARLHRRLASRLGRAAERVQRHADPSTWAAMAPAVAASVAAAIMLSAPATASRAQLADAPKRSTSAAVVTANSAGRAASFAPAAAQTGSSARPMAGRQNAVSASNRLDPNGPRLHQADDVALNIAGHTVSFDSGLSTSCDFNAVRQAACDVLKLLPQQG